MRGKQETSHLHIQVLQLSVRPSLYYPAEAARPAVEKLHRANMGNVRILAI